MSADSVVESARTNWNETRQSDGPFLEILAEELGPQRSIGTLFYLAALMFYPDNEDKRTRFAAAEVTAHLASVADGVFIGVGGRVISRLLRAAPHLLGGIDLEKDRRGNIGYALGAALVELINDPNTTIAETLRKWEKLSEVHTKNKKMPVPLDDLDKNWFRPFRSVLHLWAAHNYMHARYAPLYFPCTLGQLPEFLSVSEYIRCRAERRPLARGGMLLPKGIAFAVSPDIDLALPGIVIGQPEPWEVATS